MAYRKLAFIAVALLSVFLVWQVSPWNGPDALPVQESDARSSRAPEKSSMSGASEMDPGGIRREAAAAETHGSRPGHVAVHVYAVDKKTGNPVAGAIIYYASRELQSTDAWRSSSGRQRGKEIATVQLGSAVETDDRGIAVITVPAGEEFRLASRTRTLFGAREARAELPRDPEDHIDVVVEMEPDVAFVVRVIDENGSPVEGVPVAYRETSTWPVGHDLETFMTEADGRAEMVHLGPEVWRNHRAGSRHWVTIALPLGDPPRMELDPFDPPTDEVLLVLPAYGRVEVDVFDIDGKPVNTGNKVLLQRRMSSEQRERYSASGGQMVHQSWLGLQYARNDEGMAVFERVGLGLELEIGTNFTYQGRLESIIVQGPTATGETVHAVLRQDRLDAVVSGRLLLPGGMPFADGDLEALLLWPDDLERLSRERLRIITDAEGVFRTPVGDAPLETLRDARLLIEFGEPGRTVAWLTPVLPRLDPVDTKLGELQPECQPLVAGVVLQPDGTPHAGIQVALRAAYLEGPTFNESGAMAAMVAGYLDVLTDDEGRFRIDGPDFSGAELSVVALIVPPRPDAEFVPGQEGVVLRTSSPTMIKGRFLLDDKIDHSLLVSWMMNNGRGTGVQLQPSGEFLTIADPNQDCTLVLRSWFTQELLHEVTGIMPLEGETTDVGTIDLRGKLHAFAVEVVGGDGSVPDYVKVILDPLQQERSGAWSARLQRPPAKFLTLLRAPEVTIQADGYGLARAVLVAPVTEVVLPAAVAVDVHIVGLGILPEGVTAMVGAVSERDGAITAKSVEMDSSGNGRLPLPEAGEWRLQCNLRVRTTSGGLFGSGLLGSRIVVVASGSQPQRHSVAVKKALLETFLLTLE